MTVFTPAELAYLRSQKLGRLATVGPDGAPQVRPVGFAVDAESGTIDIIGRDNPATQKWRNVVRDGRVAEVGQVVGARAHVELADVRGEGEAVDQQVPGGGGGELVGPLVER